MKKIISIILSITCIFTIVNTLTACTSRNSVSAEKGAVCFVIADTANSMGLNYSSPLIQDTAYQTIRNEGFIGVINADGNPEPVFAKSYELNAQLKNASKQKLDMEARSKCTNLLMSIQSLVADDPEVDFHASLCQAARLLSSLNGYNSKSIILLGTGLSTTGVMDFNNNLLAVEPEAVVSLLEEKCEIPDFKGITVYCQQLADVAAPQQKLTAAQKVKLEKIYSGIVEAGGGNFVNNDIIANPVDKSKSYPVVTPITLPADTPIAFNSVALEDAGTLKEPVFLTEEQIGFVSDKAVFLSEVQAKKTIQPVAEYLCRNPEVNILLAGTTAGDKDSSFTKKLSLQRAQAVKSLLIKSGVEKSRIQTLGLGSENDPWHVYGLGCDNNSASVNRKVVIMDASSQRAVSLLDT